MKTIPLSFVFFLVSLSTAWAQMAQPSPESTHWYLGNGIVLNTTTYPPVVDTFAQNAAFTTLSQEGTSTISTDVGDLLFYTNGMKVFNKHHLVMTNGDSLLGGISSTQSSLVVPWPKRSGYYFLFTTDDFLNNLQNGLRYSVISFCGTPDGEVELATKNTLLAVPVSEKLCAVHHANGIDYWVAAHKFGTEEFLLYLIDSLGVHPQPAQPIGTGHADPSSSGNTSCAIGEMKFSPTGSHLALAIGNRTPSYGELFQFDNETGTVFHPLVLEPDMQPGIIPSVSYYGVSFSETGNYLFLAHLGGTIWRYSVTTSDSAAIKASRYQVVSRNNNIGGLQLDKHGVIFTPSILTNTLAAITEPDDSIPIFKDSVIMLPSFSHGQGIYLGLSYFVDGFGYSTNQSVCISTEIRESIPSLLHWYPNPFRKNITLEGTWKDVHLFTTQGISVPIKLYETQGKTEMLIEQDLASGIYFLRGPGFHTIKILHE